MRRERRGGVGSRRAGSTRELGGAYGSLRRRVVGTLHGKGWHEPYESRGSHTDLWETGGASPPVDPASFRGKGRTASG